MKPWLIPAFCFFFLTGKAQIDTTTEGLTNSYKKMYEQSFPNLKYAYNELQQVHDYSGNWDIDGDGKMDSVFFKGNGGAHLFFYLNVVLSSNKTVSPFPFLSTDMPILGSIEDFKKDHGGYFPKFVVHDFDDDGKMDIYLNADYSPIPKEWKKRGVKSNRVIVKFDKKLIVKDFSELDIK